MRCAENFCLETLNVYARGEEKLASSDSLMKASDILIKYGIFKHAKKRIYPQLLAKLTIKEIDFSQLFDTNFSRRENNNL